MQKPANVPRQDPARREEIPTPIEVRPESRTPVFGTAQPVSGVAEGLRRQAYALPTHDPKRWMLLLAADRAEISAHLAREAITPGGQGLVVRHFSRQARSYPLSFASAALLFAAAVLWRRSRSLGRSRGD